MSVKTMLLAALAFGGSVVGASGTEQAPYELVTREGDFEIRNYPALSVAETTVNADRSAAAYAGFRLLAGYIFGGNARKESIDMTAPVIEARADSGSTTEGQRGWVIRFMMPRGFSAATLPKPLADGIVLREEAPARMAVITFSGLAGDSAVATKTAELEAMMKARHLVPSGFPLIAQYDPPWTIPFLRRNEIMIAVR